jgi:hypothetical protein
MATETESLQRELLVLRWFSLAPAFVSCPDDIQDLVTNRIEMVESMLWGYHDDTAANFKCDVCDLTIRSAGQLYVGATRDFGTYPNGYYALCHQHKYRMFSFSLDRR